MLRERKDESRCISINVLSVKLHIFTPRLRCPPFAKAEGFYYVHLHTKLV